MDRIIFGEFQLGFLLFTRGPKIQEQRNIPKPKPVGVDYQKKKRSEFDSKT